MKRLTALVTALGIATAIGFAQPTPYPPNAEIDLIAGNVNVDSILSYVTRLQDFHTRHTYSTTTSPDVGIGAAMRWVQQKSLINDATARFRYEWFEYTRNWEGLPRDRNNLIVATDGSATERGRYIIGGHLDSRTLDGSDTESHAPGADDNGTSCAALLELIRVIRDYSVEHDLEIIFFSGEEQGLWGSEAYANHLANGFERVDGMLCLDMIGRILDPENEVDSMTVRLYAQGTFEQGGTASSSRNLQRYLKWVGEGYTDGLEMEIIPATDRPGRGSDHVSFSENGYPAVRFIEQNEDPGYQHNAADVADEITPSYVRRIARAALGGLLTMLNAPLRPGQVEVEWLGEGRIQVMIPESIGLPPEGRFYLTTRLWSNPDFAEVIDLGESREYIYEGAEWGQEIGFSVSRTNAEGLPSPFSNEVVYWVTPVDDPGPEIASDISLLASPNPFNGSVTLQVSLSHPGFARLIVYDVMGRAAATLLAAERPAGLTQIDWSPQDLAAGIYFARLASPNHETTAKLIYIK